MWPSHRYCAHERPKHDQDGLLMKSPDHHHGSMTPKPGEVEIPTMNAFNPQSHTLPGDAVITPGRRESRTLKHLFCSTVGIFHAVDLARQHVKRKHPLAFFASAAAGEPGLEQPINTAALKSTEDRR